MANDQKHLLVIASLPLRKLDREELAALARKNAEDLLMELCSKKYERAYNPECPPKRRRRRVP